MIAETLTPKSPCDADQDGRCLSAPVDHVQKLLLMSACNGTEASASVVSRRRVTGDRVATLSCQWQEGVRILLQMLMLLLEEEEPAPDEPLP